MERGDEEGRTESGRMTSKIGADKIYTVWVDLHSIENCGDKLPNLHWTPTGSQPKDNDDDDLYTFWHNIQPPTKEAPPILTNPKHQCLPYWILCYVKWVSQLVIFLHKTNTNIHAEIVFYLSIYLWILYSASSRNLLRGAPDPGPVKKIMGLK